MRRSVVTRIRAQTHQITVPSNGRAHTDIPTSPSFILLRGLPRSSPPCRARGGTLFLAPAFNRWFRRVYSTRRKSRLPTEDPTPEGLYNDTRVIDTFFTMRLRRVFTRMLTAGMTDVTSPRNMM